MSDHSEGPWRVREGNGFIVDDAYGIAVVNTTSGAQNRRSARANAKLIAASPVLLWALRRIIEDLPAKRVWLDPDVERIARIALAAAEDDATTNSAVQP